MLLCTCLALNSHVRRHAKLKLMPQIIMLQMCHHTIVKHKLNDNFILTVIIV